MLFSLAVSLNLSNFAAENGTGSPRSPFILSIIVTSHFANMLCFNKLCIGVRKVTLQYE